LYIANSPVIGRQARGSVAALELALLAQTQMAEVEPARHAVAMLAEGGGRANHAPAPT